MEVESEGLECLEHENIVFYRYSTVSYASRVGLNCRIFVCGCISRFKIWLQADYITIYCHCWSFRLVNFGFFSSPFRNTKGRRSLFIQGRASTNTLELQTINVVWIDVVNVQRKNILPEDDDGAEKNDDGVDEATENVVYDGFTGTAACWHNPSPLQ